MEWLSQEDDILWITRCVYIEVQMACVAIDIAYRSGLKQNKYNLGKHVPADSDDLFEFELYYYKSS